MGMDKTAPDRVARYKVNQLKKGLIRIELWIMPEDKEIFRKLAVHSRRNLKLK